MPTLRPSRILRELRAGQNSTVLKLNMSDPRIVELAGLSGASAVWLCNEHVPNDWLNLEHQIRAAKLYEVELVAPKQVIGRNTVHAMQSGVVLGHVAMVDGLVERIQRENKVKARVLATGSWAHIVAAESSTIEEVDEFLTLAGLRLIYERNQE
jgi:hypothetical protein